MNCNKAEEYINRNNSQELSGKEKLDLHQHIKFCEKCQHSFYEMDEYFHKIDAIKNIKPSSIDKEQFTNVVIGKIQQQKTIRLPHTSLLKIASSEGFRIASIVIILLSCMAYFVQSRQINTSIAKLETKYEQRNTNENLINNYSTCVDQSQKDIAMILVNDLDVQKILQKSGNVIYPSQIKRYSSQICQQSFSIETLNKAKKKQLLMQILLKENNL